MIEVTATPSSCWSFAIRGEFSRTEICLSIEEPQAKRTPDEENPIRGEPQTKSTPAEENPRRREPPTKRIPRRREPQTKKNRRREPHQRRAPGEENP